MDTIELGEGAQAVAEEAIETGGTLGKWYIEYKMVIQVIGLIIVVIILLMFMFAYFSTGEKLTSEVGSFDRDSLEIKEWLCEFDLLQHRPEAHRLTKKEVEHCRSRAKLMNDNDVDKLYCEYNTYIREMAKRKSSDYKLSDAERRVCAMKHGIHGQRYG